MHLYKKKELLRINTSFPSISNSVLSDKRYGGRYGYRFCKISLPKFLYVEKRESQPQLSNEVKECIKKTNLDAFNYILPLMITSTRRAATGDSFSK